MKNIITIKAKHLKWLPYGFNFVLNGKDEIYSGIFHGSLTYRRHCYDLSHSDKIQVDKKEFEKECINSIKEFVETNIWEISKYKNGKIKVERCGGNNHFKFYTKCDPRPNEDTYTINLK